MTERGVWAIGIISVNAAVAVRRRVVLVGVVDVVVARALIVVMIAAQMWSA